MSPCAAAHQHLSRGTSFIRCGDPENGRKHVLDFKNVLEKRSVVRFQIKKVHEKRSAARSQECKDPSKPFLMGKVPGLLEIKDTHQGRVLQQGLSEEHRTTLGAVCVLNFE